MTAAPLQPVLIVVLVSGESAPGEDEDHYYYDFRTRVGSRPKPVVEPSHRVRNIPCDLHYEDRGVLSAGVEILIGSATAAALP